MNGMKDCEVEEVRECFICPNHKRIRDLKLPKAGCINGWMDADGWIDDGWMDGWMDGLTTNRSLKWGAQSPPSECKHTTKWMGREKGEVGGKGRGEEKG
ncbi:unnamed protein product [Brugia pahangi]|uniref:Zf-RVT domain-containing protein n=1 Tax=Brugia pahangi TaxID=6280 RepID=A0A0N4TMQ9_BRUPA|nr:unnamed protein product [Brugia pahangi]